MKRRIDPITVTGEVSLFGKTLERVAEENLTKQASQRRCSQLGIALALRKRSAIAFMGGFAISFAGVFGAIAFSGNPTVAQITPDTTLGSEGSIVTPNADVRGFPAELIEGGATRGANLFHSFDQFNVGNGQRVYFANPTGIENILTRVTGNTLSNILGTLGVNGGANLFLLNPNGIIFGENARLDIAGSFVASTANSLVFENGIQFSATNPEAAPLLTINVTPGLQYGTTQPKATIANSGNLAVGQNLTLSAGNLDLQGQLQAGRDLTLQAQDTVKVRDRLTNPFIASSGGKLLVEGNQRVDIFALNHPDSGFFSGGDMVLRSANTVKGDAHYWSGGSFQIEKLDGRLGNLDSPYDPIILANGNVSLGDYTGASLHILAGGSVTLGNVEINATDSGENTVNPDNPDLFLASLASVQLSDGTTLTIDGSARPTLDVRAGIDWASFPGEVPGNTTIGTATPTPTFAGATRADIIVSGNIRVSEADGVVLLTNQYRPNGLPGDISAQDIDTGRFNFDPFSSLLGNGGSITIDSQGNITTWTLDSESIDGNGGAIALTASASVSTGTVNSGSSEGNGGAIAFRADGDISINSSDISTNYITSGSDEGNGGTITLTAGGNITTAYLSSSSDSGDGGAITLTADGDITAGSLSSSSLSASSFLSVYPPSGNGGALTLTAGGNITTDNLYSFSHSFNSSSDNGGAIALTAGGNITTGTLSSFSYSHSSSGNGGAIALTASGNIITDNLDSSSGSDSLSSSSGKGGAIALTAINGKIQIINGYASVFPQINASGLGGGNITIKSPAGLFELEDGLISSNAFNGNGGNIQIEAASVAVTDTNLTTTAAGMGNAGSISITTNGLVSLDKSRLFTSLERGGTGRGGDITIEAGAVSLTNASFIDTATFSLGDAGNVKIEVDDSILLDTNSAIFSITAGIGNGGNVTLKAGDAVELNNASNISTAVNPGAQGNGGNIAIEARSLSLTGGSQLVTNTSSSGKAGDITVNAAEGVLITGVDPNFTPPQPRNVSVANPPPLNEVEPNNSIAQAQPLTQFFLNSLDDVNPNVEFSTSIPYVSISGEGSTRFLFSDANYYSFEVETAGTRAIFDIDGGGSVFSTGLYLFDSAGNRLASNFGASPSLGAGGSRIQEDPYIRYAFSKPGTYFIQFTTGTLGAYTLQVSLDTPNLATSVDNGVLASGLFARSESAGLAGKVTINTPQLTVLNGGNISATATAAATSTARGGSIAVNSSQVNLSGNTSGLFALTQGAAPAGSLTLQPYNNEQILTVNLQEGAQISASTSGAGKGGSLTVTAPESITITGNGTLAATAQASSTGQAGDVKITTPQLTVANGARVSASTNSANPEAIGGSLEVQAEQVNLIGNSSLSAGTTGAAPGGNLIIQPLGNSQSLTVNFQDGSTASAATSGSGKGGTVTVTAPEEVTLSGNGSLISAETTGRGTGGDIGIETGQLTVQDGAQVRANASSSGNGGNLTVNASDSVQLRGENSGLFVNATAGSIAGNLTVTTRQMSVSDGAQVTVSSPQGQAGNLNITANSLTLNRGTLSAETAKSDAVEGGANITLSGLEFLRMDNESLISASALSNANGGNVTIDSIFIVATPPTGPEGSDIIANARQGNGGRVNITTQGLFGIEFRPQRTPKNDITVSSTFGLSGEYILNTPGIDPSRGLAELPTNVVDASEQIDRRCTPAGRTGERSSFTVTGRGGLPPSPNEPLRGESAIANWISLDSDSENNTSSDTPTPKSASSRQLVEAQGWMINEKGEVILTASAQQVTPQGEWLNSADCSKLQTQDAFNLSDEPRVNTPGRVSN